MSNIRSKTRRQTDTRKRNRKGGKSQKKRIGRKNKTVLKGGEKKEQERMRPLSDSEIKDVLEESGFMDDKDNREDISYWTREVRNLRYDNWVNCFTGEIDKNLKEQAIAKIQYWMLTGNWRDWEQNYWERKTCENENENDNKDE